ncbi:MAG: hypothetical protein AB1333_02955 [Patescibacteria group bacterium]
MEKKKKIYVGIFLVLIVIVGVFTVRFFFGGNEDEWICVNGKWEAHGKPLDPIPPAFICE